MIKKNLFLLLFRSKIYLIFLLFLFSFPYYLKAQTELTVEGRVLTPQSEPVERARISFVNTSYFAFSDASGYFRFEEIPAGDYIMTVEKSNFSTQSKKVKIITGLKFLKVILDTGFKELPDVTVTAQKREEILQEVPFSITSLSYKSIKEGRIQNVSDLTAISPNLYAQDPGDGRTVTSIRGVISTSYDPAIATYIDGVNQFSLDTYIPQLFDIERIEVLRGPQGTLYGRNAMGGVINILTRQPEPGKGVELFGETTVANYGQQRILAGIRIPLYQNKLHFGAAGLYNRGDGFYVNVFDQSNYDQHLDLSGNYFLQYFFNEHWQTSLNFKHFTNKNKGAFPLVMGIEEAFDNPYRLNQNETSTMVDNSLNTSLVIDYRGLNLNFSSQTSYQRNYRYYHGPMDADFSPLDAISIFNNYGSDWNSVEVITQELRFSSPGHRNSRINWTAGTFLFSQKNPVRQATRFGEDAGILGLEENNFSLITTSESSSEGVAFFGQVDYAVTKKLNLIAGLRYDFETKEQSVLGEYQRFESQKPDFEFQSDTTAQADFQALSPKAGISYSFSEENMVFATYSRGFRAGGLTPLSSDPSQPPLFKYNPEFSNNYELGSKNELWEGKFFLNATIFYTVIDDVQVPTLILPDAVTITKNTGKLTSKGLEMELKGLLFPGLEFSYDFGYTDAKYRSLKLSGDEGEQNLEGNMQIFTPQTTSMLSLQYKRNMGKPKRVQGFIRGEWRHLGKQYFDLKNTLVQHPYHLFNAHLGLSYKEWQLTFWGRNISDTRYISYGYNFGAVRLGNPFTYGVTLSAQIGS